MGLVMSALSTTAAKSVFGDLLNARQTVASNTPATLAASKFADYLEEKQGKTKLPDVGPGMSPSPELLSKVFFGNAYDADTKTIQTAKFAVQAEKNTAEFAGQLKQRLASFGIDPNMPVGLSLGGDGRVIVDNSHPKSAEIAKMFTDDPVLTQSYRDVVAQNDQLTLMQAGAAYAKDWNAAKSEVERGTLWTRYSTLMDKMANMFSGRMTFGPSTVVAENQQMLRRMGLS